MCFSGQWILCNKIILLLWVILENLFNNILIIWTHLVIPETHMGFWWYTLFMLRHYSGVLLNIIFKFVRSFSHDATAAIVVYKTMNRPPCLRTKKILWDSNSFHILKLSFIPSNLQSCWPRDWKRSIIQPHICECIFSNSLVWLGHWASLLWILTLQVFYSYQ